MPIINNKKELAACAESSPVVIEFRRALRNDDEFKLIMRALVGLLATFEGGPDFGDDWEPWLTHNISGVLQEAASIVG